MHATRQGPREAPTAKRGVDGSIQLAPEWRAWIAENLVTGRPPDDIVAELRRRGCPRLLAKAELEQARTDPYLYGAAILKRRNDKLNWLVDAYRKLAEVDPGLGEIPRRAKLPADEFFREYYAKNRPVILTGMIDHWPAMARWSLDYFESAVGDTEIEAQTGREADPGYEIEFVQHKTRLPFRQFLAWLREDRSSNDFYITSNNTDSNRAAYGPLWADIGALPGYLSATSGLGVFFWIGPRGTITPFHHDLTNNLLMQIRGTKRITLVPSWETLRMANSFHCFSQYTGPEALAALPADQRPVSSVCTLEPGEALFIPVGWWHHVEGLETTIGLSFTNFARPNDFFSDYRSYGPL